jgi:hypothetical protein
MRRTVRTIGSAKKRRLGKYASEVALEHDLERLIVQLVIPYMTVTDWSLNDTLRNLLITLAAIHNEFQTDIHYIAEPIERKYLRFTTPSIQDTFTIQFRFRQQSMTRLMACLG